MPALLAKGVKGGQQSTGAQKDGMLKYGKGAVAGVYDLDSGAYVPLQADQGGWTAEVDARLGQPPAGWMPWKKWVALPNRDATLMPYLASLWGNESLGCAIARSYLLRSAQIAQKLVADGVARRAEDVNGVLLNGFYHAYGPINEVTRKHLAGGSGKVTP